MIPLHIRALLLYQNRGRRKKKKNESRFLSINRKRQRLKETLQLPKGCSTSVVLRVKKTFRMIQTSLFLLAHQSRF